MRWREYNFSGIVSHKIKTLVVLFDCKNVTLIEQDKTEICVL